jgi:group I intron endonuclease
MKIPCDAIQKYTCGIYLIRNLKNNKIYIGQSKDILRRWQEHLRSGQPEKYSIKSERDFKAPIHRAMQKYGIENFSIQVLEICEEK